MSVSIESKHKLLRNVNKEALKKLKIISIKREENESKTLEFLIDYYLKNETNKGA